MTSLKDSRPSSQHRLSVGPPAANGLPSRRTHSHSISLGSVSGTHRVNRRKSSNFGPRPTLTAAVEIAVADGSASIRQRTPASRAALGSLNDIAAPMPRSLPHHVLNGGKAGFSESALEDGPPLAAFQNSDKTKSDARRASDGTHLSKKEKASAGDLKCEHCGKTYKHGSCLHKHRWEHTPQWQVTSKLLISKHQQVQLLEAASALMNMNQDGTGPNDSDNSSSPAASGSSDLRDDSSSPETTPPPTSEHDHKRFSNHSSSAFSRSYQSVFSDNAHGEHNFSHTRNWSASTHSRPVTANTSYAESYRDEDPADLAAAVGLLSCSYGTPKSGPSHLGMDVPPVPPLPEKYQMHSYHHQQASRSSNALPPPNAGRQEDVDMDEDSDVADERSHEDDDGVFALDA